LEAMTVSQYAAMFAAPEAAVSNDLYAVDLVPRPPCEKALQSPNAAEPLASGPFGAEVEVDVSVESEVSAVADFVGSGVALAVWTIPCEASGRLPVAATAAVPPTATAAMPSAPRAILLLINAVKKDIAQSLTLAVSRTPQHAGPVIL
jgi:hypothetical protein